MIAHVHRGQQVKAAGAGMSFMRVSPFGMAVKLFDQHKERGGVEVADFAGQYFRLR